MKFRRITSLLLVVSMIFSCNIMVSSAEEKNAKIVFGSKISANMLSSDILPEIAERNGVEAIILDPDKTSTNLNIAINSGFSRFKNGECVNVSVTYYDEGDGKFALYYDGANGVVQHEDIVRMTNSEQWITKTYFIQNPKFKKGIKGGFDLQFAMNTPSMSKSRGKAFISKVEVDLVDYNSVYDVSLSTEKEGNIFTDAEEIKISADMKIIKRMKVDSYVCDALYEVRDEYDRVCWTGFEKGLNLRFGAGTTIYPENLKYGLYHLYVTLTNEEHNYKSTYKTYFSYMVSTPLNHRFGTITHYGHNYPNPEMAITIAEKAGIGMIRDGIYWSAYEKEKGVYSLNGTRIIPAFQEEMEKSEIEQLYIAVAGNALYSNSASEIPSTEEAVNAYAEYCAKIAQEIHPEAIEIWNEPNTTKFGLPTEFATYTKMMKAAYTRIKEVAPDIQVIGCCLMSSPGVPLDILGQIFDAGGGDYMDAVSVHPYMWMSSPLNGGYEKNMTLLKEFLKERGYPDMKVWITELGYGGGPSLNFNKEQQAAYLVQGYVVGQSFGNLDMFMWYDFQDDGLLEDDREENFGLVKNWNSDEPWGANRVLLATSNMNSIMTDAEYVEKLSDGKDGHVFRFKNKDKDIYAVFSTKTSSLFGFKSNQESVTTIDIIGNETTIHAKDGVINIIGGEEVVYIVGENLELSFAEPTVNITGNNIEFAYGESAEIGADFGRTECDNVCENLIVTEVGNNQSISFKEFQTVEERLKISVTDNDKTYLSGKINVKCLDLVTTKIANIPFSLNNFNRWIGTLSLTNNSKEKDVEGTFEFVSPDMFSEKLHKISIPKIKPGETKEIEFNFPEIIRKEAYNLNGIINLNGDYKRNMSNRIDFAVATYAKNKPVIDGVVNEDEWNLNTSMDMMYADQAVNLDGFKWGGVEDLSGRVCIEYDEDNFYFAAIMKDDIFCQPHNDNFIWKGDGIQFGTAYSRVNGNELSTAFSELSFALTSEGEKVYLTVGEDVTFKTGEMNQQELGIECKIKREGNITSYELKLPKRAFTPLDTVFENGRNIAFSMLVNDNDGLGRKGWLEYASGIGKNKNVTLFTFLKMIEM